MQVGQVVAHVPAVRDKSSISRERFGFSESWNLREPRTHVYVDKDTPVQWFEAASIQWQSVLRTGAVVDQPTADAGAAVRVFTGRLEGALQYVSTHTAEETFIHVAHKPVQIIAHPARRV